MRVARKPSWVRTGQRALGGLLTSSAAEKEVGCPYGSPSRPLALVARGELGANRKLALLLLRSVRPKGGIPDQARRLALARLANAYSVTSCRLACAFPPVAGQRLGPTARLQRKSAVCGLNGFLPRLCLGSLHLNPSTPERFRGSCPFASSPAVANGKPVLPFWKEKLRSWGSFSLQNGIQKNPGGKGRTRANTAESRLCGMTAV